MATQLEELKKTLARLEGKCGTDNAFRQGLRSQIARAERYEHKKEHRPNPMSNFDVGRRR